jgi:putative tricarboxylic transport membrane protein
VRLDDRLLGLLIAALGGGIWYVAAGLPTLAVYRYGPGFFPGLIGAGLVLFGLLMALRGGLARERGQLVTLAAWARSPTLVLNALAVIGATVAYALIVDTLGFLITAAVLLFLLILLLWRRPLPALVVALVATLVTQQAFAELLLVPLPWGVLESWSGMLTWR